MSHERSGKLPLPRPARDHEVMYNSGGARARASSAGENLGRLNELRAAFGIAAAAGALESLRRCLLNAGAPGAFSNSSCR